MMIHLIVWTTALLFCIAVWAGVIKLVLILA